jgi:hypothetical protein
MPRRSRLSVVDRPQRFSELDPSELDRFDVIVVGNSQRASVAELTAIARAVGTCFSSTTLRCIYNGNFPPAATLLQELAALLVPASASCFAVSFGTWRRVPHRASARGLRKEPVFAASRQATLGCSLFSQAFFAARHEPLQQPRTGRRGSCIVYSPNPIKGYAPSRRWALEQSSELGSGGGSRSSA